VWQVWRRRHGKAGEGEVRRRCAAGGARGRRKDAQMSHRNTWLSSVKERRYMMIYERKS